MRLGRLYSPQQLGGCGDGEIPDALKTWISLLTNLMTLSEVSFWKQLKFLALDKEVSSSPQVSRRRFLLTGSHWLKLNIEGVVKGNPGPTGGGGLLRDHRENWINGFSANLGWRSSVKAELLALLKGLQLAWNMGVSHLEVEIDSQLALKPTQEPCKANQAHCFVIRKCQSLLLKREWYVKIKHCYRESNKAADLLANIGVCQSTPTMVYNSPPTPILSILFEDISGVFWQRFVHNGQ